MLFDALSILLSLGTFGWLYRLWSRPHIIVQGQHATYRRGADHRVWRVLIQSQEDVAIEVPLSVTVTAVGGALGTSGDGSRPGKLAGRLYHGPLHDDRAMPSLKQVNNTLVLRAPLGMRPLSSWLLKVCTERTAERLVIEVPDAIGEAPIGTTRRFAVMVDGGPQQRAFGEPLTRWQGVMFAVACYLLGLPLASTALELSLPIIPLSGGTSELVLAHPEVLLFLLSPLPIVAVYAAYALGTARQPPMPAVQSYLGWDVEEDVLVASPLEEAEEPLEELIRPLWERLNNGPGHASEGVSEGRDEAVADEE